MRVVELGLVVIVHAVILLLLDRLRRFGKMHFLFGLDIAQWEGNLLSFLEFATPSLTHSSSSLLNRWFNNLQVLGHSSSFFQSSGCLIGS